MEGLLKLSHEYIFMSTSKAEKSDFLGINSEEIRAAFPESMLSIKDKFPQAPLLFYLNLTMMKALLNREYSEDQFYEIIKYEIGCIPDAQRDPQFNEEINNAFYQVLVDVRPIFCTTPASLEYCKRKKIPAFVREWRPDNYKLNHAVFNLLCRRGMLSKTQMKQIQTVITEIVEDTK